MRILQFTVEGQRLSKSGDFTGIIRGSKKYLRSQFVFNGSDWNGCKVVAVFQLKDKEYPVAIDSNRSCMVPDEVTDSSAFKIRLIGRKNDYQITTNKVLISQEG